MLNNYWTIYAQQKSSQANCCQLCDPLASRLPLSRVNIVTMMVSSSVGHNHYPSRLSAPLCAGDSSRPPSPLSILLGTSPQPLFWPNLLCGRWRSRKNNNIRHFDCHHSQKCHPHNARRCLTLHKYANTLQYITYATCRDLMVRRVCMILISQLFMQKIRFSLSFGFCGINGVQLFHWIDTLSNK